MTRLKPNTTVLIITYNSKSDVGSALSALTTTNARETLRCIVVDNASSDGTADFVSETFPWVTVVRSGRNLGFGRGCNLGFEHVRTPYVLIQNPDAVIDSGGVHALVDFLNNHAKAGIVAPAIVKGAGKLQSAGLMTTPTTMIRSALGLQPPMKDERRIHPGSAPFQTTWVSGAIMMIRSDVFRRLGGFDPRFFLYFEETDLCRRAAREGVQIWAVGEVRAEHVGAASATATGAELHSGCISEHFFRSRFYYLVKHFGWFLAVVSEVALRVLDSVRARRRSVIGRTPQVSKLNTRPFLKLPAPTDDVTRNPQ